MKFILILLINILLISCDGFIRVKIYTYENNSVEGIFYQDTLLDGTAVPYTYLRVHLASRDTILARSIGFENKIQTDSLGKFESGFVIPPMTKNRDFHGTIIAEKEGYKKSVIPFRHSSVDSVMCIINMERIK